MKTTLAVILISIYLMLNTLCEANDAPLRSIGRTVRPTQDVPVQMVSEKVEITINYDFANVACTFELLNLGDPDTIEVGFPFGPSEVLSSNFRVGIAHLPRPKVETRNSDSEEFPIWKTFKVPFDAKGQKRIIYNFYSIRVTPINPIPYPFSDLRFRYVLRTGAYWQGLIERAEILVYLRNVDPNQCTKILPSSYNQQGAHLSWTFRNFEPTQDIEIEFMQALIYQRLTSAKLKLQISPNDPDANFQLGSAYFHLDKFESARAEEHFLKAIEHNPNHLNARWFLSELYAHNNKDLPKAIAQLEYVTSIDPNFMCFDGASYYPNGSEPIGLQLKLLRKRQRQLIKKAKITQ